MAQRTSATQRSWWPGGTVVPMYPRAAPSSDPGLVIRRGRCAFRHGYVPRRRGGTSTRTPRRTLAERLGASDERT